MMENYHAKVLLFGEYSLMYNSKALIMPCDRFSGQLNFFDKSQSSPFATTSNEYLKRFSAFIASLLDENFVLEVKRLEREVDHGLFFESNIPQGYGLGSSGALVAAIFLRYLKKAKGFKDDMKSAASIQVDVLRGYLSQLESFFHGISSGLDPLSIILNKPLLLKNKHDIATARLPMADEGGQQVVFLLNTGMGRYAAPLIRQFSTLSKRRSFRDKISQQLIPCVNDSIDSFLAEDMNNFYQSMEKLSLFQLKEMAGFIPESFHEIMKRGATSGDFFLKLCGAGGGGFLLGFTSNWETTRVALSGYQTEIIYRF